MTTAMGKPVDPKRRKYQSDLDLKVFRELGPRYHSGQPEFYCCLRCDHEWRAPLAVSGTGCPACGSPYVEWVSYDTPPWECLEKWTMPAGKAKVRKL